MYISKFLDQVKKIPRLYLILISIFYFFRFIYFTFKEKSILFLRYYPGHYSSTISSKRKIEKNQKIIFDDEMEKLDGIELNESVQLEFLDKLSEFVSEFPFSEHPGDGARYYYNNPMFGFNDGIVLNGFIHLFKPGKIIEVGSGYSSALMLDVVDSIPEYNPELIFIEPFPTTLNALIGEKDRDRCTIIESFIQDVPHTQFDILSKNDILFIDSSHTLSVDSDLSKIIFLILPALKPGVIIQFHDIFWPFEYPKAIFDDGRLWNESYYLRAFLQFNEVFEIIYFSTYMTHKYEQLIEEKIPGYVKGTGNSLWLRKKC